VWILDEFFRQLLGVLDITNGFNWRMMVGITAITFFGEIYIQVPLLMESFWMIVGYQVGTQTSYISVTNTIILFVPVGKATYDTGIFPVPGN
jgi:hypothetical protein